MGGGAGVSLGAETMACRSCGDRDGELVLDLGLQPPSDYFPDAGRAAEDPLYPLQMWVCTSCHLAQLVADPTIPEEPRAVEPAALVAQAEDAVGRVAAAGLLRPGARMTEYGSPHGGSWLGLLAQQGLSAVGDDDPADLVVDCFGLMHAADQSAALAERAARVAPAGTLLLQFHTLATIVRLGQWNSLRHGHYAYYSTAALVSMLDRVGFQAQRAWCFDLYGGTVLIAAQRAGEATVEADGSIASILEVEDRLGATDPDALRGLQNAASDRANRLHEWLVAQRAAGVSVVGYGAASRAVSYLCRAEIDKELLPAVADASPAKQGRRMPGTEIPIVAPEELITRHPDAVALFLPDLLPEVRQSLPEIEASGAVWVDVDSLGGDSR